MRRMEKTMEEKQWKKTMEKNNGKKIRA